MDEAMKGAPSDVDAKLDALFGPAAFGADDDDMLPPI